MSIKSPGERFCYLCDAVTPAECVCDKYCSKCDKQFASIEAYRSHDCLIKVKPDVVGNTGMFEKVTTASIKRNEEEYRRIWNSAIESAAHQVKINVFHEAQDDEFDVGFEKCKEIAFNKIRELKK